MQNAELLKEILDKNNLLWVRVRGKSMFPILTDDSLACVALSSLNEMCTGDVAIFKEADGVTCHRVFKKIKSDGDLFLRTKSDIDIYYDPLVRQDTLLGKVVAVKKLGLTIRIDNPPMRFLGLFIGYTLPVCIRPIFYLKNFLTGYEPPDNT